MPGLCAHPWSPCRGADRPDPDGTRLTDWRPWPRRLTVEAPIGDGLGSAPATESLLGSDAGQALFDAGQRTYGLLRDWTVAESLYWVSPRSAFLCAALSELARTAGLALGHGVCEPAVSEAAALLAFLTKVDDDIIDALAFHGGCQTPRPELERRTAAFLRPTLRSLLDGKPATREGRCHLAADVGQRLHALTADPGRLRRLLGLIRRGWAVQARAVATLTAHPGTLDPRHVEAVSRDISGVWLLMVTAVGTLPARAARPLHPSEERAFFAWGGPIQRADALADLSKDLSDGHACTLPGRLLFGARPQAYIEAFENRKLSNLYALLVETDVDRCCLPAPGLALSAARDLAALGQVPDILRWVHGLLTWRYLTAPDSRRSPLERPFHDILDGRGPDFAAYTTRVVRTLAPFKETSPACSEP